MNEELDMVIDRGLKGHQITGVTVKQTGVWGRYRCSGTCNGHRVTWRVKESPSTLTAFTWDQVRKLRPWVDGKRWDAVVVRIPVLAGPNLFDG